MFLLQILCTYLNGRGWNCNHDKWWYNLVIYMLLPKNMTIWINSKWISRASNFIQIPEINISISCNFEKEMAIKNGLMQKNKKIALLYSKRAWKKIYIIYISLLGNWHVQIQQVTNWAARCPQSAKERTKLNVYNHASSQHKIAVKIAAEWLRSKKRTSLWRLKVALLLQEQLLLASLA